MGSTISIVLAVVAVIVGFLILNNLTDDGPSAGDGGSLPVDSAPVDTTGDSVIENTTTTSVRLDTRPRKTRSAHASCSSTAA